MPMIDVYAREGTVIDKHQLAADLATTLMRIEEVPDIPMFRDNTAAGRRVVHGHLANEAKLGFLVGDKVRYLSISKQGLRRNASDVQTDATPILLFHHRHRLAELCCADGCHVSTRTSA
jgi:hypothetical protein